MPYQSMAIANKFLEFPGALGKITQMQAQKLVYISHGWNLALNYEPLISEPVRAWDYGPVFPDLYEHARYYGKRPIERPITPADANAAMFFLAPENSRGPSYKADLHSEEVGVISHVWNRYKSYDAFEVSDLTHQPGTPWFETYFNVGKNGIIDNKLIETHYRRLAEFAQSAHKTEN